MKVSVIIPLYNSQNYVRECLESVRDQTFTDVEIIVVNDGSTDDSLQIVQSIASEDKRVHVYNQKNQGASVARNVGLKHATGQYIQFLDSDDKLDRNKIKFQMDSLEAIGFPQDIMSFSKWAIWGASPADMPLIQKAVWHDYECPVDILLDFPIIGCCMPSSCYLVPVRLIKRAGRWDETLTLNDDGEFFARIIRATKRLLYVENAIAYYRSTPGSLSKSLNPAYADSWVRSLIATSEIIRESQKEKSEEAVCKMMSSCLARLYPYYRKQRKKGEEYLLHVYPYYIIEYPQLNWKEFLYWGIQYIRRSSNL